MLVGSDWAVGRASNCTQQRTQRASTFALSVSIPSCAHHRGSGLVQPRYIIPHEFEDFRGVRHSGPEHSKSTWRRSSSANGHRIRLATRPPSTRKTMCPRRTRRARLKLRRAPRAAGALVCGRRSNRCTRLSVLTSSDRPGVSALSDLAAGWESRQGFGSRRARSREEPSSCSSRRPP